MEIANLPASLFLYIIETVSFYFEIRHRTRRVFKALRLDRRCSRSAAGVKAVGGGAAVEEPGQHRV